ncbi:MAG: hypothetical protein QXG17_02765 [Sulfolobales archaeon]
MFGGIQSVPEHPTSCVPEEQVYACDQVSIPYESAFIAVRRPDSAV